MINWSAISGGCCQGQPWRVGVAGFSITTGKVFVLSDMDWADIKQQMPLEPLSLYGKGNGFLFEHVTSLNALDYDGLLLIAHDWQGQAVFQPAPSVRQYLILVQEHQRSTLENPEAFAKIFAPQVPGHGDEWIYLDSRVMVDPACPSRDEWALFPPPKIFDVYHLSADYWLNRVTAAIALDVADVRNARPKMSVVIPCYNYGRFLRHCVQSVLDQGQDSLEVLVLDNASTDETPQVMAAFAHDSRVRYMRNRYNCGAAYNWEKGRLIAKGKYFTFLSADDYFNEGHLARLLPVLESNPQIALGYTSIAWVDEQGQRLEQPRHPGYRTEDYVGGRNEVVDLLVHDNYMAPSAVVHQRDLFYKTWRPVQTLGAGDWDMAIQMAEQYPDFAYVDTPGVSYRWHGAQHSQQHFYSSAAPLADHLTIVEGVLERNAQHHLKGREREVAAHIERRLALYPAELESPLGDRARALVARLDDLARFHAAPLFSIVLTTYNRPDLLRDALASLGAQTLRDFEVVLVNDNGDPVEHLLDACDFPVTYVKQGCNQGLSAARNAGLQLARGRYVAYLDDDDIYLPEHLAVLAEAFKLHPQSVVYVGVEYVTERLESGRRVELGRSRPFLHEVFDRDRLFVQNYIPVNTWAHPRDSLADVGLFDVRLSAFEDWDMLLRLAARHDFLHVPQVTSEVHVRGQNIDGDHLLAREHKNFSALYREIYRRHKRPDSEALSQQRQQMLQRMDEASRALSLNSWLERRVPTEVERRLIDARLSEHNPVPSFGILILDLHGDAQRLARTRDSISRQRGVSEHIHPVVLSTASVHSTGLSIPAIQVTPGTWVEAFNQVVHGASFDWCVLVQAGDEFTTSGLLMACLELSNAPQCRAIYCDEMYRQPDGRLGAALRPDFNLDYLLSFPAGMAGHWLFRRDVLVEAGGLDTGFPEAAEFELILRLINIGGLEGLGHVAEPLLITDTPLLVDVGDERRAIIGHLHGRGYPGAEVGSRQPGCYQVAYGHLEQPLVSVLIGAGSHLPHLQRCVESLLETTRYPHYELLLLETEPAARDVHDWLLALEALGEPRLRPLWAAPATVPVLVNQAAQQAGGDYLLLLSPDTAIVDGAWLHELINHAQRPEVGAVGAKLLTVDGKVHQAGMILGLGGVVGGLFQGEPLDAPGYMQRLQVDQNYSALGGECLMVRKALFIEVGGLDEQPLLESWSDIDLCLRLQRAGYLNVWTPRAQLLIDASSACEFTPAQEDALFAKWLPLLARDPAYNPGFSLQKQDSFKLAPAELSWRPLQSWRPLPRILAHPADSAGCGHYRVMQPHRALREQGLIEGDVAPLLLSVVDLERYDPDVIILQKQVTDERLESMRRMGDFSRAFKIYELDDHLPNLPLKSIHRQSMPRDILRSMRRGFALVDRLVVSTEALADTYSGMHADIRVVQNRLSLDWWKGVSGKRRTGSLPRVGWAGGISHTGDLELIADVVKELASEVEWVFFGMCPDRLKPYISEFHPGVKIESYPEALARLNLDLALAPVEQNLFNECKSNLRLLEYGACGFPVICSEVRCYQGDGLPVTRVKNRFRDWVDAIRAHIHDLDAAARAGDELRAVVLRDWMLDGRGLEAWRKAWLPD